ncbi:MAG TPA: hypothetical protein VFC46_03950 [Humisphaera sp.]|nr:hypothetical protein [Humisphaera sp.]
MAAPSVAPQEPATQMAQTAMTVVAEIPAAVLAGVRATLAAMDQAAVGSAEAFPFEKLTNVHFSRFVILDPAVDLNNQPIPPALVFLIDFDGSLDSFLPNLLSIAAGHLDQLFGSCQGYSTANNAARAAFLKSHMVPAGTLYVNWVGRTVAQVQQEADLQQTIEEFVDRSHGKFKSMGSRDIRTAIVQYVRAEPSLAWAREPLPPMPLSWRSRQLAEMTLIALIAIALLPLIAIILPFFIIALRMHEKTDVPSTQQPDLATLDSLAALEDHVVHNQFSAIGLVKPGPFRKITMTVVLFAVNFGTRFIWNKGNLSGVNTIHFARWVFLNDKRRLIFASNYDGSLESYMDDFIDKVGWGLNAVFSNGVGYPKTNWLIYDGSSDEQAFKDFLHTHQIPTQIWYSAYPQLTGLNLVNNAKIRAGLYGEMSEDDARVWLALL